MFSFAQEEGRVGINTDSPTENLDIVGTLRVRNLPESGVGKIIGTSQNGELSTEKQTFRATKMVVADSHGVLGTAELSESTGLNSLSLYSSSVNTDNENVTVDLSKSNARVFVINDVSTNDQGGNMTTVVLPKNRNTPNETRIIRLMIIPVNGGTSGGLQIQPVGNEDNFNLQAAQIQDGVVLIGDNVNARYSTIYTFVEYNDKWYMSVGDL
ncbi:hypothetical protein [Ornithobacterium rhinotracheale]|nr:hypothetical protein [Ornithobacterium rhinotracheale]MCK0194584.1 hypothetical protein [Ornithobacterium rhinotracheale]MCK0200294.1 hypothetical protein [Ornithobacterium rhinotracheale]UOH64689.1 hypothetical protein MT993_05585 [Ornithobacterium rhinotracheale]UOH65290.1 hypothetical protein MT999_08825 [Ornithobacterium rhinotracheale]